MPDIGGGRLYSGENNWIYFVPGTAEDNGTWFHGTTSTRGTAIYGGDTVVEEKEIEEEELEISCSV